MRKISEMEGLHATYRVLYWEMNEMQLCGTPTNHELYVKCERMMARIVRILGYTPEA